MLPLWRGRSSQRPLATNATDNGRLLRRHKRRVPGPTLLCSQAEKQISPCEWRQGSPTPRGRHLFDRDLGCTRQAQRFHSHALYNTGPVGRIAESRYPAFGRAVVGCVEVHELRDSLRVARGKKS